MLMDIPGEIRNHEYRAGLTPAVVRQLAAVGPHLRNDLNIFRGKLTHRALRSAAGQAFPSADQALAA